MLPDLWRMAHRHVRPALGPVAPGASARVDEVLAGVAHHARADAAFHASDAFRHGERAMTRALATVGAPRLSLFGHIAWELCLDGALLIREGDALVAAVREGVACARASSGGEPAAAAAARIHHAARKGEGLPTGFDARVDRMLTELERGRFMEGYARGDIVAERLDGIRGRLGFAPFEANERATLAALLEEAIARADDSMDPLLALCV